MNEVTPIQDWTFSDAIEQITNLASSVTALRGAPLVLVTLIGIGYALKFWPKFPNKRIPMVSMLIGIALAVLVMPRPSMGDQLSLFPHISIGLTLGCQGLILWGCAWGFHIVILKPRLDPLLFGGKDEPELKQ